LTLTVSTPELGEVSIVIDRAEGGVRVVLGVGGRAAEQRLEPEKAALIQSLRGVGLDVHSVNVVQQTRVGTLLAQRGSGKAQSPSAKEEELDEKQQAQRKKHKRIDLIG
jgi:flagellar hook-length control protein FliK